MGHAQDQHWCPRHGNGMIFSQKILWNKYAARRTIGKNLLVAQY
jgi:hypothetical protein